MARIYDEDAPLHYFKIYRVSRRGLAKFVVDNVLQIVPLNFAQIVVANEKTKNIEHAEWKNSGFFEPYKASVRT